MQGETKCSSVTSILLTGGGEGTRVHEADLCPCVGCFGGVSSGGALAMPVTGSFTPGQTERQLQGPEFRNSLKENLVGLFVGRGT